VTAYVDAWRDYRWRCRLFGAAVVGALLLAPWGSISRAVGVLACILAYARLFSWRCPRCGGRYFVPETRNRFRFARNRGNPLAQSCLNCGLPKWAEHDPDPAIAHSANCNLSKWAEHDPDPAIAHSEAHIQLNSPMGRSLVVLYLYLVFIVILVIAVPVAVFQLFSVVVAALATRLQVGEDVTEAVAAIIGAPLLLLLITYSIRRWLPRTFYGDALLRTVFVASVVFFFIAMVVLFFLVWLFASSGS